jgi:hypothetical protein
MCPARRTAAAAAAATAALGVLGCTSTVLGSVLAHFDAGLHPVVARLVTVQDGSVRTAVELLHARASALDLAVDAGGRYAYLALAESGFRAELVTVDLATGDRVAAVPLCAGDAVLGPVALAPDGRTLTAVGGCTDGDGPRTTAFVVTRR